MHVHFKTHVVLEKVESLVTVFSSLMDGLSVLFRFPHLLKGENEFLFKVCNLFKFSIFLTSFQCVCITQIWNNREQHISTQREDNS
jgi:hypothetical protein